MELTAKAKRGKMDPDFKGHAILYSFDGDEFFKAAGRSVGYYLAKGMTFTKPSKESIAAFCKARDEKNKKIVDAYDKKMAKQKAAKEAMK